MSERRKLEFGDWDEVISNLRQLESGYQQHKAWNLEQSARHIDDWIRFPMDGFPKQPIFMRGFLWVLRTLFGKSTLKSILAERRMKDGIPTAPQTVYEAKSPESERKAVEDLIKTIERFRAWDKPLFDSPFFGPTDHETASKLHLVHAAHHLSWLEPA